jgi:hypothetical protein
MLRGNRRGFMAALRWAWHGAMWPFHWLGRLVFGPPEAHEPEFDADGNPNYAAIRRRVGRRFRRRGWFVAHLVTFVLINIGVWINWMEEVERLGPRFRIEQPWPATITLAILLLMHAVFLWVREAEDRAVDAVIERAQAYPGRKRHHDPLDDEAYLQREMRLGADGELVDIVFNDNWENNKNHAHDSGG